MRAVSGALGPKPKASFSDIVGRGRGAGGEIFADQQAPALNSLKRAFDIADISQSDSAPTLPVVAQGSWSIDPSSPRGPPWHRPAVAAGRGSTPPTWRATWRPRPATPSAWSSLDLQLGEVSTTLHLRPPGSPSRPTPGAGRRRRPRRACRGAYLEDHELGFSVLAGPFSPADTDMIAPKDVSKVIGIAAAALRLHRGGHPGPPLPRSSWRLDSTTQPGAVHGHAGPAEHPERARLLHHAREAAHQQRQPSASCSTRWRTTWASTSTMSRTCSTTRSSRCCPTGEGDEVDQQGKPALVSGRRDPTSARSWRAACSSCLRGDVTPSPRNEHGGGRNRRVHAVSSG